VQLTALGEAVGTVSRGISQQQIDALPARQYYEVAGAAAGPEEQCPICRWAGGCRMRPFKQLAAGCVVLACFPCWTGSPPGWLQLPG
jgi:hypothetical protein